MKGIAMDQRKALGKGLGSLIPMSGKSETTASGLMECKLEDIIPNPDQPRKLFAKEALDELALSIEEKGILQPLLVRLLGGGKYELIAGERRYRAAMLVGLVTVPVIVKDFDDATTMEVALIENIQRQDLNPIEEALAYKELLSRYQYTQDDLAKKVGKDRSSIANALRLLKLPDRIREYLIDTKLSMGHARSLLGVENRELQQQMAEDIITNNLSVREVENMVKNMKHEPENRNLSLVASDSVLKTATHTTVSTENIDYEFYTKILEDNLQHKVQIGGKTGQGQILIKFSDREDLEQLVRKIVEPTRRGS